MNLDDLAPIFKIAGEALRVLQIVGSIAAILVLSIYAIKWFMANPNEKAVLKSNAVVYIVGSLMLFCGPIIVKWFIEILLLIYKSPVG